jgi:hypothetical protein
MEPQTADVRLPAESDRVELTGEWTEGEDYFEALGAGASATVEWSGGACFAVLSGLPEPGPHPCDGTFTAERQGMRIHGFQFTPGAPVGG